MHPLIEQAHALLKAGRHYEDLRQHDLKGLGWEYVANGAFSTVMRHPEVPGKVLKVCRGDDIFQAYVLYCQANPGPFLPVYEDLVVGPDNRGLGKHCVMVTMESLEGFTYAKNFGPEWQDFQAGVYSYSSWRDEAEEANKHMALPRGRQTAMDAWHEGWKMAAFFGNDAKWDLHDGNVMINRATGHIQVTDPLFNNAEQNAEYIKKLQHWRYLPQLSQQLEFDFKDPRQVEAQGQEVPRPGRLPVPVLRGNPGAQVEPLGARRAEWPNRLLGQFGVDPVMIRQFNQLRAPQLQNIPKLPQQAQRVRVIRERLGLKDDRQWDEVLLAVRKNRDQWLAHGGGWNIALMDRPPLLRFQDPKEFVPKKDPIRKVWLSDNDLLEISLYLEQQDVHNNPPRIPVAADFAALERRLAGAGFRNL